MNAFEFFQGVPMRVILDNLKSGILRPNTYDPVFNRAYGEWALIITALSSTLQRSRGVTTRGKFERKYL